MNKPNVLLYTGIASVAALLGGFGLLADEVVEGETLDFDKSVLIALREPGKSCPDTGTAPPSR